MIINLCHWPLAIIIIWLYYDSVIATAVVITTLIDHVEQHAQTNEAYMQHFQLFIITVHMYKKYWQYMT